jgi:CBS domain containing-hemolysin-like protein
MGATEWFEVVLLIICFVVSALASATETALTSIGRLRVRFLAEQGSKAAAILQRLRADPNRFLSTVLFTNTLALIVAMTATAQQPAAKQKWATAATHAQAASGVAAAPVASAAGATAATVRVVQGHREEFSALRASAMRRAGLPCGWRLVAEPLRRSRRAIRRARHRFAR